MVFSKRFYVVSLSHEVLYEGLSHSTMQDLTLSHIQKDAQWIFRLQPRCLTAERPGAFLP